MSGMEVYGDLTVTGPPEAIEATIAEMTRRATGRWRRDQEREEKLARQGLGFRYLVFVRRAAGPERDASAFIVVDLGRMFVSNILSPPESLSVRAYNEVLKDLEDSLVRPSAERSGTDADASYTYDLTDHLTPRAFQTLQAFSALANRETLHHLDWERWYQFVVQVHRDGTVVEAGLVEMVGRWLTEVEGWLPETANDLASDFAKSAHLLRYYDEKTPVSA